MPYVIKPADYMLQTLSISNYDWRTYKNGKLYLGPLLRALADSYPDFDLWLLILCKDSLNAYNNYRKLR